MRYYLITKSFFSDRIFPERHRTGLTTACSTQPSRCNVWFFFLIFSASRIFLRHWQFISDESGKSNTARYNPSLRLLRRSVRLTPRKRWTNPYKSENTLTFTPGVQRTVKPLHRRRSPRQVLSPGAARFPVRVKFPRELPALIVARRK